MAGCVDGTGEYSSSRWAATQRLRATKISIAEFRKGLVNLLGSRTRRRGRAATRLALSQQSQDSQLLNTQRIRIQYSHDARCRDCLTVYEVHSRAGESPCDPMPKPCTMPQTRRASGGSRARRWVHHASLAPAQYYTRGAPAAGARGWCAPRGASAASKVVVRAAAHASVASRSP